MPDRLQLARNWLPRYTGMPLDRFGNHTLLTNFRYHVDTFTETFGCEQFGEHKPMQAATNDQGLTIINFGIGSANAATIMDLLSACQPKGVLFLGKCGGLKRSTEIGHFILPIAAIRGEGPATTISRPRCRRCPRSNSISLSPRRSRSTGMTIVPVWCTRRIDASGSTTTTSWLGSKR